MEKEKYKSRYKIIIRNLSYNLISFSVFLILCLRKILINGHSRYLLKIYQMIYQMIYLKKNNIIHIMNQDHKELKKSQKKL